jgi:hypothetical protein
MLEKTRKVSGLSPVTVVIPEMSPVRRVFDVTGLTAILNVVAAYDSEEASETLVEYAWTANEFDVPTETSS